MVNESEKVEMAKSMLTHQAFKQARRFIEAFARPLEVARLHYAFNHGSATAVVSALREYQNTDGGFGHALDPDLRTDSSSALATSIAFQVLRSIQAGAADALVTTGIAYSLETLDKEEGHWRIIPRAAESMPHAPWWSQAGREDELDSFSLNPTAEILGYLYDYQQLVPSDLLRLVADRVAGCVTASDAMEMHDLLCCCRLLQTRTLPEVVYRPMRQKLPELIDKTVSYNPELWGSYGLRPVQVVDSPESPYLAGREGSVAANLDYEIASQNEDGSWTPTWSWGGAFPQDWAKASREWAGVITLDKLLLLKRFKRIELP